MEEFLNKTFTVHDLNGVEHTMNIRENLIYYYDLRDLIVKITLNEKYMTIVDCEETYPDQEDWGYYASSFNHYHYIFFPEKITENVVLYTRNPGSCDYPTVLSSIDHNMIWLEFCKDEICSGKFTPLQNMMYQDILTIIKKHVDEQFQMIDQGKYDENEYDRSCKLFSDDSDDSDDDKISVPKYMGRLLKKKRRKGYEADDLEKILNTDDRDILRYMEYMYLTGTSGNLKEYIKKTIIEARDSIASKL